MPRPWPDVQAAVPPLTPAELERLAESIRQDGVQYPILVLPDGRIIDGHHRWKIGAEAAVKVVDIPEEQALALAVALNVARRQLSEEQISTLHEQLRRAKELRRQTAIALTSQGHTHAAVASIVGVGKTTVQRWFAEDGQTVPSNEVQMDQTQKVADSRRRKIPLADYDLIKMRVANGETMKQVSLDYGVHPNSIWELVHGRRTSKPRQARAAPPPSARPRAPHGSSLSVKVPATDDAHAWNRALISVDELLKGLRDRGGMVALARRWPEDRRAAYVGTLERLIARLSACREDILTLEGGTIIDFPNQHTGGR
jgi:transposase